MTAVRFQGIYLIYIFVTVVTATIPYFLKNYLQNNGLGIGYECFNNFALYVQLLILTSYIRFGYLGSRWNISFRWSSWKLLTLTSLWRTIRPAEIFISQSLTQILVL